MSETLYNYIACQIPGNIEDGEYYDVGSGSSIQRISTFRQSVPLSDIRALVCVLSCVIFRCGVNF